MSFFATEDDPAKVARFYTNAWRARRLFVRSDVTHMGGVVSAVDGAGGKVYQVMLTKRGEDTLAFPSVTAAPFEAAGEAAEPSVVPLFPGSRGVLDLASKDDGPAGARVSMSVNDGTVDENVTHYTQALAAAGYEREVTKQPDNIAPGHRILLYRGPGREVTVNLHAITDKSTRVHIAEVGQP